MSPASTSSNTTGLSCIILFLSRNIQCTIRKSGNPLEKPLGHQPERPNRYDIEYEYTSDAELIHFCRAGDQYDVDIGVREVSSQILVAIGSMAGPGLGGRMARFSRDNGTILFRSGVREMRGECIFYEK